MCVWMLNGCGVTVDGGVSMCAHMHVSLLYSVLAYTGFCGCGTSSQMNAALHRDRLLV